LLCQISLRSYAVGSGGGDLERTLRPQITFFPPLLDGYATQKGWEERFLKGFHPSKPPT
jgi:hypothetical protein